MISEPELHINGTPDTNKTFFLLNVSLVLISPQATVYSVQSHKKAVAAKHLNKNYNQA